MRAAVRIAAIIFCFFLSFSSAYAQVTNYWKIGADTTHVWSLATDSLILTSDSAYVAWLALGFTPSTIASTSELYDAIAASYPSHLAASAPGLEAAGGLSPVQAFTWRKVKGLAITYTGASALTGRYPVDDQWLGGLMTGALLRCGGTPLSSCSTPFPAGATTFTYSDMDFAPRTMTIVQMQVIVLAIEDHFARLYAQLQVGIAGGTPSWPALTATVP